MTYIELQRALDLFGLGERASLNQIKSRHRLLVKRYHPDSHTDTDLSEENDPKIREINEAYQILSEYCSGYRFSFCREEFMRQQPEEHLKEQFGSDPVWNTKGDNSQ